MAKSWQEAYRDFDSMTVPELKDLLKSKDMPVSGRKIDLIRYLIFDEYSDLHDGTHGRYGATYHSDRLKLKYEKWLAKTSFDAINYQDINS